MYMYTCTCMYMYMCTCMYMYKNIEDKLYMICKVYIHARVYNTFNGTITIMRLHAYPIGADVHSYIHTLYMYERERERDGCKGHGYRDRNVGG